MAEGYSEAATTRFAPGGIPDHARLERLSAIGMPVFVANGDSDPMILPHYSYLLACRFRRPG